MNRVNVPKLRFPGFDGEWRNCLLNDVTKYTKGFAFKSEDYQENGIRIVRVSDLSVDSIKTDNEKVYIDTEKSKLYEKYKLKSGNIIITTVGSKPELIESAVGRGIYIQNDSEGLLNQNMLKLENIKNVNNAYIIGLINSKKYQHYMKSIARGNANQANITVVDLLQFPVSIPTLPEQQKIASFLSTVDEKIQQLSRKKELLEQYKKGVMQQLFSGKLRFKDENGRDYPDWEEKRLGDLTYKVGKKNKENFQYPIYSINNKEGFLPQSEQFDGLDSNDRGYDISLYKIVESETFAYNPARINVGSIGYSYNLEKVIVSSLYVCFKTIDKLEDLYLLSFLDTYNFKKEILRFEEGGVRQYLFYENFSMIKIPLPSNKEQQKIANFLSSIDAKIENTHGELEKIQLFKKGLLQKMFV